LKIIEQLDVGLAKLVENSLEKVMCGSIKTVRYILHPFDMIGH
jgi:hypothetical protein